MTATTRQALDRVLSEHLPVRAVGHARDALLDALVAALPDATPALLARLERLEAVAAAARAVQDWSGTGWQLAAALRALDEETEPRTEAASRHIYDYGHRFDSWERSTGAEDRFRVSLDAALAEAAEQGAREARSPLVLWLESRLTTKWSDGWSEDFRRGYDAAVEEVSARVRSR